MDAVARSDCAERRRDRGGVRTAFGNGQTKTTAPLLRYRRERREGFVFHARRWSDAGDELDNAKAPRREKAALRARAEILGISAS